jgi:hypothetical protein
MPGEARVEQLRQVGLGVDEKAIGGPNEKITPLPMSAGVRQLAQGHPSRQAAQRRRTRACQELAKLLFCLGYPEQRRVGQLPVM